MGGEKTFRVYFYSPSLNCWKAITKDVTERGAKKVWNSMTSKGKEHVGIWDPEGYYRIIPVSNDFTVLTRCKEDG